MVEVPFCQVRGITQLHLQQNECHKEKMKKITIIDYALPSLRTLPSSYAINLLFPWWKFYFTKWEESPNFSSKIKLPQRKTREKLHICIDWLENNYVAYIVNLSIVLLVEVPFYQVRGSLNLSSKPNKTHKEKTKKTTIIDYAPPSLRTLPSS